MFSSRIEVEQLKCRDTNHLVCVHYELGSISVFQHTTCNYILFYHLSPASSPASSFSNNGINSYSHITHAGYTCYMNGS